MCVHIRTMIQVEHIFMSTSGQQAQHPMMILVVHIKSVQVPLGIFLCQVKHAYIVCEYF